MDILKQFEALSPEEIVLVYDTMEKSIEYHKKSIADWQEIKEEIRKGIILMEPESVKSMDNYYKLRQESVNKFSKILLKIEPLKMVVNGE